MQTKFAVKPIVVVSQCLGFAAVRYNGQMLEDSFVRALARYVEFVQVCPEMGIGLGVPRDPIRIQVEQTGARRLVQPSTGRDLTGLMREFAEDYLSHVGAVDGFILKSRSPSCGVGDVKIFVGSTEEQLEKSSGMFASVVLRRFPQSAIENEGNLTDSLLRHRFLVKLWAMARWRVVRSTGDLAHLKAFHEAYKPVLLAYRDAGVDVLEGILAAPQHTESTSSVFDLYAATLSEVLTRRPNGPRCGKMTIFDLCFEREQVELYPRALQEGC